MMMGGSFLRWRRALPWTHGCHATSCRVLTLLILCGIIQAIYIYTPRGLFKVIGPNWTPWEEPFKINDNIIDPRRQNEGRPHLLLQQNGLMDRPPPDHSHNLNQICQPKTHIFFLKTHKTASTSIQNIMYRYGESRDLVFALPKNRNNLFGYPELFQQHFVERKDLTHFDIMCNHMRFNKSEVMKVMPEDSFYFSILRHPVSLMESGFVYFKTLSAFQVFRSIDDFLDRGTMGRSKNDHLAHNNLAFDFGYDHTATASTPDLDAIVNKVIAGIEQDFHLILISEYYDESMILLKHVLCWSLEDVVSFTLNSRSDQSRKTISPMTAEKIKRWNVLDWRIYCHFNATFWDKVRSVVGEEEVKREVSELREKRANLTSSCLRAGKAINPQEIKEQRLKPFQSGTAVILGYALNPDLDTPTRDKCLKLIMPELTYTRHLYEKQFSKLAIQSRLKESINVLHQYSTSSC